MGTPFSNIYTIFFANIHSYKLALLDQTSLEEELSQWLVNGIAHFTMARTNLYSFNQQAQEFSCTLEYLEQQILGKCMTLEYMNTHLFDEKNLSSALNSRDYRTYSPAKQLDTLIKLHQKLSEDLDVMMSKYSYNGENIRALFKREPKNERITNQGI